MKTPARALTPAPTTPYGGETPSSPGEGGRKGTGEEGRGGEGPGGGVLRQRFATWTKILSAYFTAQTLTQLAGIAAGLLFVNLMPVREFALYTLAFSVVTFFNFVSDLGSTTSLVYFFHQARKEGSDFRPHLAAVLSLRRVAFLLGAAAVVAIFPRTAGAKGFGLTESLLVTAGILLCVWFQIGASLRVLALRLADRYGLSYRAEIAGGLTRLLLAVALVAAARLEAWLGVLTSAVASAVVVLLARADFAGAAGFDLRPYRRKILRYLLPTLPSALYFAVQGPLTIWLAATFGGTRNIAEVGALGRLGLLVGIFSSLTGVVFLPRLARVTDDRLYRRRFLQFGGALAAVALAMLAAAAIAPGLFLFLLGKHYSGLHRELLLVVGGAAFSLLDGYAVSVNLARSWTRWQGLAVGSLIAVQALLVALLPLSTTAGVLTFNLLGGAAALVGQLAILAVGFTRPEWVHWK
jgi:O-antigen/teichoic acid export membrane protein